MPPRLITAAPVVVPTRGSRSPQLSPSRLSPNRRRSSHDHKPALPPKQHSNERPLGVGIPKQNSKDGTVSTVETDVSALLAEFDQLPDLPLSPHLAALFHR